MQARCQHPSGGLPPLPACPCSTLRHCHLATLTRVHEPELDLGQRKWLGIGGLEHAAPSRGGGTSELSGQDGMLATGTDRADASCHAMCAGAMLA